MTNPMTELRRWDSTITDEMRAVRRLYRVERSTGSVIRKSDGQIVGWVHTYSPGDGRVSSCRLANGGDFTDEWSVTHAVCLMHRSPADPAEVEKWLDENDSERKSQRRYAQLKTARGRKAPEARTPLVRRSQR